jgi:hypothetical protein
MTALPAYVRKGKTSKAVGVFNTVQMSAASVVSAGTVQGNATQLTAQLNLIGNCPAGGVKLVPSIALAAGEGIQITVDNQSGNTTTVYTNGSPETVNGGNTTTGVTVATGKQAQFTAYTPGVWFGPVAEA